MDKKLLLLDKTLLLPVGGSQYVSGDGPYGEIHLSRIHCVIAGSGDIFDSIHSNGNRALPFTPLPSGELIPTQIGVSRAINIGSTVTYRD